LEWKKVLDTFKRKNNKLIVLKLSNEIIIKATPEHRFFVSTSPASLTGGARTSNNWIEAAYLEVGMKLLDTELKWITIRNQ
jgi:intein/homing endonuclease